MATDTAVGSNVEEITSQAHLSPEAVLKLRTLARGNANEAKALQTKLGALDSANFAGDEKHARKAAYNWALGRIEAADAAVKDVKGTLGLLLQGELALDHGNTEKALSQLKSAAEQSHNSPRIGLEVALALAAAHKGQDALDLLARLEKQGASDADYFFAKGRALESMGMQEQSLDAFQSAIEKNPQHAEAAFRLAYFLDLRGDDDRAVELYKSVTGTGAPFVSAMINLALLLEDKGEVQDCIGYLKEALRVDPTNQRAALYLRDAIESLDMYYDENERKENERMEAVLRIPISDFELSVRSRNCLAKMNVKTLGDLVRKSEPELLSYKNFGETSLTEIKHLLEGKGLRLGMFKDEENKRLRAQRLKIGGGAPENANLARPISEFEFSVRSRKCMQRLNIETLADLVDKTEAELLAAKNFGQTSLNEIKAKLTELGLGLKSVD